MLETCFSLKNPARFDVDLDHEMTYSRAYGVT